MDLGFVVLFYGVWCGSLWVALLGLGVFISKNKDPFWSPLWQTKTADASILSLIILLLAPLLDLCIVFHVGLSVLLYHFCAVLYGVPLKSVARVVLLTK